MENIQEQNARLLRSLLTVYATGAQMTAADTAATAHRFAAEGYDAETVAWWQNSAARYSETARMWMDRLLEQAR